MDELTIREISALQSTGDLTAVKLTRMYLDQITSLDQNGPGLNAIIEINPDALAIAEQRDHERSAGKIRSPLHGVPILLKDNIDTADRMLTTAGSLALVNAKPLEDAFIVKRLRKAGAVILGKTNLSEWANFRSSRSTSGWSSRGGLTRNPYALDRTACGSSSGSAVAVAANLTSVAVGTETDGSIICPSHTNGIVGIKPTLGLVSRTGIIPFAHSQDTAGPMARTVDDAAILLSVLAGYDREDQAGRSLSRRRKIDYGSFNRSGGLKDHRIGVARQYWDVDPNVDKIMENVIAHLRELGAVIIDPVKIPNAEKYDESELEVLLFEFKADLNRYLARLGPNAPMKNIDEIIAFNEKNASTVMPFFGQERMLAAREKGDLSDAAYKRALARNKRYADRQGLARLFDAENLDAVLAPSGCPAWLIDLVSGDHYKGGSSSPAAVSGYPSITIPAGYVWGLPVGLSLIGRPFQELKLIEMGYDFEIHANIRLKPEFRATANPDLLPA